MKVFDEAVLLAQRMSRRYGRPPRTDTYLNLSSHPPFAQVHN
jgi:hypothetical protein